MREQYVIKVPEISGYGKAFRNAPLDKGHMANSGADNENGDNL